MPVLDIIGETCLQTIHDLGFPSAVIAGGMVRDAVLGSDWKDIDVFIPNSAFSENQLNVLLNNSSDFELVNLKYGNTISRSYRNINLIAVADLLYAGGIKVQIMPYDLPDDDMFKYSLINDFNFGIDQAVYDGKEMHLSDAFKQDQKKSTATLMKLTSIEKLPHAMQKFFRLQEKYPDIIFKCPSLSIKKERKTKAKVKEEETITVLESWTDAGGGHNHTIVDWRPNPNQFNPAAEMPQLRPQPPQPRDFWRDEAPDIAVEAAQDLAQFLDGVIGNNR